MCIEEDLVAHQRAGILTEIPEFVCMQDIRTIPSSDQ